MKNRPSTWQGREDYQAFKRLDLAEEKNEQNVQRGYIIKDIVTLTALQYLNLVLAFNKQLNCTCRIVIWAVSV